MKSVWILFLAVFISGCASTPTANPKDPYENFNRKMFKFNDALDRNILKPVAQGYEKYTPQIVQKGFKNFFSNIDDIGVTINDLLQLKFKQAASDGSRVLFNTTFGLLGFINVTDRLEKHNEDFGQTLGYWGVGSGPYLVLPFFGPSNIRDGASLYADGKTNPILSIEDVPTRNGLYVLSKIEARAGLLEAEKTLEDASDNYAFIRDFYMARRENLVYDGNPPKSQYIDEED